MLRVNIVVIAILLIEFSSAAGFSASQSSVHSDGAVSPTRLYPALCRGIYEKQQNLGVSWVTGPIQATND
jgi:hypothetical protein